MIEVPSETPAISVKQPWADLILRGKKTIEIRQWRSSYRGLLWLHTGLKSDAFGEQAYDLHNLFKGGFLGLIRVESIVSFDSKRWEAWRHLHLETGEYVPGLYAWFISVQFCLKDPIVSRGNRGLFLPDKTVNLELLKNL